MGVRKYFFIAFFCIVGFISLAFAQAANENLTVTTYYPSPSGTYNNLSTNRLIVDVSAATPVNFGVMSPGDALINNRLRVSTTNFSPNTADLAVGGNVAIGSGYVDDNPPTNGLIVEGNVGVGTNNPRTTLDVNGAIRLGRQNTCNPTFAGTMRYNSTLTPPQMEYCDGSDWRILGGFSGVLREQSGTLCHAGNVSSCVSTARCRNNEQVIAGGCDFGATSCTHNVSRINLTNNSWQCTCDNSGWAVAGTAQAFAVCARN